MNTATQSVLVGLVAGLASALLVLGGGSLFLAVLLSACATLPILIAGLGWSNVAGTVSVIMAVVVLSVTRSPAAAAAVAVTTLAPAAWIAHLSNLARPAEEIGGPSGQMAWYPLSDMLLHLCGLVTFSLIVLGVAVGYNAALVGAVVDNLNAIFVEQGSEFAVAPSDRAELVATTTRLMPAAQAMMLVQLLFGGWYVATAIVRVSGRARRPADDIPASLRMSRLAILIFGAGLLMSFAGGPIGLVGSVVSGAFGGGFILAGLAIMHDRSRGRSWRPFLLWSVYVTIMMFALPLLLFLIVGLMETARTSPLTKSGPPSNDLQE